MIPLLGVLGGLVFDFKSLSLNQEVGGTLNDTQRKFGGERLRLIRSFNFPPLKPSCDMVLIQPYVCVDCGSVALG